MKNKRALRLVILLVLIGAATLWLRRSPTPATHDTPPPLTELAPGTAAVPNELVVDFRDDESHSKIAELGRKLGVTFEPASRFVDTDEIYTVDTPHPEAVLEALRADPSDVEAASYQLIYSIPENALPHADEALPADGDPDQKTFPNDPKYKYQWHLRQIHMEQTWKAAQGDGVIVAVIDTGVAHVPDLAQTQFVPGYNFVTNSPDATDDHGHGTHVAGTIAQSTNNGLGVAGVAYHAKIMPIKVLSARGSGSVSGIAEGIRFAADHGAKVINMSLGGPMSSSVLANAVKYAHDKGVVVVCAAGNDGRGKVSYPAAYPGAIAVAATQFDESTTFYSNWGKEIDVAAPGGNTRVDQNGDGMPDGVLQNTIVPGDISRNDYLWFMGTSMASPHVAGVAALIESQGVTDPDAVEALLKETARKPSVAPPDSQNRYGAGIVDAAAAVRKAQLGNGVEDLGLGLGMAALLLFGLKRRGTLARGLGAGGWIALTAGASGLFFLPQLGLGLPGMDFLARGLPEWDIGIFGAAGAGNLVFYSALIPLAATVLLYGSKRLRGVLAGLTLGVGANLLAAALFSTVDVKLLPLAFGALWLIANALFCFFLARLVLRKS